MIQFLWLDYVIEKDICLNIGIFSCATVPDSGGQILSASEI